MKATFHLQIYTWERGVEYLKLASVDAPDVRVGEWVSLGEGLPHASINSIVHHLGSNCRTVELGTVRAHNQRQQEEIRQHLLDTGWTAADVV